MVSAPVLLVFYTRFIIMMVVGRSVRWDAQPRDDRGVAWTEALDRMRLPALTGVAWLAAAAILGGATLRWSASLLPGLLLGRAVCGMDQLSDAGTGVPEVGVVPDRG